MEFIRRIKTDRLYRYQIPEAQDGADFMGRSAYGTLQWIRFFLWCQQMNRVGERRWYDYRTSKAAKVPVILVVNKIDKVRRPTLGANRWLPRSDGSRNRADFSPQGNNVSRLIDILSENLEEVSNIFSINHWPPQALLGLWNDSWKGLARHGKNSSLCCSSRGFQQEAGWGNR